LPPEEWRGLLMIKRVGVMGAIGFITAYLLFRNIWISMCGMLVFVVYGVLDKRDYIKNRNEKMQSRFLDFLMCLEPLLKTQGTFYGAFSEAAADYRRFHGKDDVSIFIDSAVNEFRLNMPTAEILGKMAERLNIEDARIFAGSMAVCESTGGNAVEVTGKTTELLVGKARILCDINTLLSGKALERKIITIMPFVLLAVLSVSSGSYLEPLYSTAAGRIIMIAAGALFILQWFVGRKFMDVKV